MVSLLDWVPGGVDGLAARVEERIRGFWRRHGGPLLYVGFSGGKDSAVALAAAVRAVGRGSVVAWFWHIPGQTVSDNVLAARRVARVLGLAWRMLRAPEPRALAGVAPAPGTVYHMVVGRDPYWRLLRLRGPPAPPPRPRWCCRFYKEEPLSWTRPWRDGRRYIVNGVKRADSRARARRWADACERVFRPRTGPARLDVALAPLCDLGDPEVWALARHYGVYEAVHQQYAKWGRSPNCALCPLASKRQLEQAARILPPSYIERYLEALEPWDTQLARRMKDALRRGLEARGERQ